MSTDAGEAAVARERPHESPTSAAEHCSHRSGARSAGPVSTLRHLEAQQPLSHHEQVRQRRRHDKPMAILGQPTVTPLGEAEGALAPPKGMVGGGGNGGLPPFRRAQLGGGGPTMDEVACARRPPAEGGGWARVRRAPPAPPFVAV